jgi:hypothetical protein
VFKVPRFPINDPAFFEYFGRSLLHGGRLYSGDLIDLKLPSIYLINALWQAWFGSNYFLHICAEAAINAGSIVLFAVTLRRAGVTAWALGTFLFAVFFSLPFPQFDYAQHYSVFFIVLAVCLSFYGRYALAMAALALATTFWFPAALTCLPILMQRPSKRWLRFFIGFVAVATVYVLGLYLAFGPQIFAEFMTMWTHYVRGSGVSILRLSQTLLSSGLGPGVLAMLALLLLVVRRPTSNVSRFALVWSACALAGFVIPPRFSEHYLLPSTPALAMAIAAYGFSLKAVVRRPIVALLALALLSMSAVNAFKAALGFAEYATYVEGLGRWIRSSVGSGAVIYSREFIPEVQLASDARKPGKSYAMAGPLAWQELPQVILFGPNKMPKLALEYRDVIATWNSTRIVYKPVCPGRTGRLIVYAESHSVNAFRCSGPRP